VKNFGLLSDLTDCHTATNGLRDASHAALVGAMRPGLKLNKDRYGVA
jgi:hypothetical protein